MPRAHSWTGRTAEILSALMRLDAAQLDRGDVESLFAVQRRAALRLMEIIGPSEQAGEWRVDRLALIGWIEAMQINSQQHNDRKARLWQALRSVNAEKQRIRAELLSRGKPEPVSWSVSPTAFAARMDSLPDGVQVTTGQIVVTFPSADPAQGAKLLHQLSLVLLNDWETFELLASGNNSCEVQLAAFCDQLDHEKQEGVNGSKR